MWFKQIKSFEDLKGQFRALVKANHPDNGGSVEAIKEINVEYDALFPVWKNRAEKESGEEISETAESYRKSFYTQSGWAGSNYDSKLTLKEIAKIVRLYVKEQYPTFRFSVRTHYASMCQELHVSLTQAPFEVYLKEDELTEDDLFGIWNDERRRGWNERYYTNLDSYDDTTKAEIRKLYADRFIGKILREDVKAMFDDVDNVVKSYNYEDVDGMIDYCDVNFFFFGCKVDDAGFKIVQKCPRIAKPKEGINPYTEEVKNDSEASQEATEVFKIGSTGYTVEKTQNTKTGETIFVVRIIEKLGREDYLKTAKKMKEIGGYYSRFVHGFVFRDDPSEKIEHAA